MSAKATANGQSLSKADANFDFSVTLLCWSVCNTLPSLNGFCTVWSNDNNSGFNSLQYVNDGTQKLTASATGFSSDLVLLSGTSADTAYFAGLVFPANGGATFTGYFGTGAAALSVVTTSGNYGGMLGTTLLYNESADDQFLNGEVLAMKIYDAILTADDIANEYRQWAPKRTGSIYSFPNVLNVPSLGVDWSGVGNTFSVTGVLSASGFMPPIPYAPQAMILGG